MKIQKRNLVSIGNFMQFCSIFDFMRIIKSTLDLMESLHQKNIYILMPFEFCGLIQKDEVKAVLFSCETY